MKLFYNAIFILFSLSLFALACKSSKKTQSSAAAEEIFVPVSNIALYDKPLDTIKKHVTGQRWQLIYSTGGIAGDQMNRFDNTYYTLTRSGKLVTEKDGKKEEAPYTWEETRDIFTGNKIHVISGVVYWKVEGIYNDTLRLSDNYADGFGYALIRSR